MVAENDEQGSLLRTRRANRVESREALSVWLCRQHNVVNAKLGKPAFPCDFKALDARWRTGAKECWPDDAETATQSLGQE